MVMVVIHSGQSHRWVVSSQEREEEWKGRKRDRRTELRDVWLAVIDKMVGGNKGGVMVFVNGGSGRNTFAFFHSFMLAYFGQIGKIRLDILQQMC